MFLMRTIFWVSLFIFLLPVGDNHSNNLMGATKQAFSDRGQFCQRNIDICNITAEAWGSFKYKVSYGFDTLATLAEDFQTTNQHNYVNIDMKQNSNSWLDNLNKQQQKTKPPAKIVVYRSQNTLTKSDLAPEWSVKQSNL